MSCSHPAPVTLAVHPESRMYALNCGVPVERLQHPYGVGQWPRIAAADDQREHGGHPQDCNPSVHTGPPFHWTAVSESLHKDHRLTGNPELLQQLLDLTLYVPVAITVYLYSKAVSGRIGPDVV